MRVKALPKVLLLIGVNLIVSACVVRQPVLPNDPYYAPVVQPAAPVPGATSGSLYREGHGLSLFGDKKAHRLGDILTVILEEQTVSSKSSSVGVDKDSSIKVDDAPGGNSGTLLGTKPTFKNLGLLTDLSSEREFTGEADADQSNSLQGNITVTVTNVLANGTLIVRGEKWMTLNRGDEYIRISGLVRPDDITPDNTVVSTRLANARISYSGTGALADSGNMGWLSRFFNSPIWPF